MINCDSDVVAYLQDLSYVGLGCIGLMCISNPFMQIESGTDSVGRS
jgi:hypothetical protein